MKKLAALAVLSTAITPAFAADIIVYDPPPPAPVYTPAPTWTGFYVGGQAGYAFHDSGSFLPDAFITIPGTPGTPGETIDGGTFEYSFACAGVADTSTCAVAIEGTDTTTFYVTRAELVAALAQAGEDGPIGLAGAGEIELEGSILIPPLPPTPGQTIPIDSIPGVTSFSGEDDGFIGGIHVGYDHQFGEAFGGGAFVLGVMADLSYVDIERFGGFTGFGEEISVRQELDYLATLRLRAGIGFERALVYATGGLAFGDVDTTYVNTILDDTASVSDTRVGYTVGGGVEFLATRNVSIGIEYLYTDLGDGDGFERTYDLSGDVFDGVTGTVAANDDFNFHTVWARASFRFN